MSEYGLRVRDSSGKIKLSTNTVLKSLIWVYQHDLSAISKYKGYIDIPSDVQKYIGNDPVVFPSADRRSYGAGLARKNYIYELEQVSGVYKIFWSNASHYYNTNPPPVRPEDKSGVVQVYLYG